MALRINKNLVIVFFAWSMGMAFEARAQRMTPSEELAFYKEQYPDEPLVMILKSENVKYQVQGDSIVTTIQVYKEIMHLTEKTIYYSGDQVYSSSFVQVDNLEAYTLVPGKKKYSKLPVEEFKVSSDHSTSVFYDDSEEKEFTYPAIGMGCKTVLSYTETIINPKMMGSFFFDSYMPIDQANYEVNYDSSITINPQPFNIGDEELSKLESEMPDGNKRVVYKTKERKKIEFDSECPSFSSRAASLYIPIHHYQKSNGEIQEVISTPEELHRWYRTFIDEILAKDESVKALVSTIVSEEDAVFEKVQKIFNWVQTNIKYIAFENGMRGFIPHSGKYVIDKRYGDCKDMASAIVSMLREADIEAHYTWIGTRTIPYGYAKTPSPITDNHMIASFRAEDQTYFLDATGQYTPIGWPTSMIQGKESLISLGEDEFVIEKVPVIEKEKNILSDSVSITLEGGNISGEGRADFSGYHKVYSTYSLIQSNQKDVDEYLRGVLEKGSNKFELDNYDLSNVENIDVSTKVNYEFKVGDYYKEINGSIYINLILDRSMSEQIMKDRKVAFENDYKYISRDVTTLDIPEGYKVQSLPDHIHGQNDFFSFDVQYHVTQEKVIATKTIAVDFLVLDPKDFEDWDKVISAYARACRKAIILTEFN